MSLNFGFIQNSGGSSDKFLPISGGTMSGNIDMDNNDITNMGSAIVDETYTTDEHAKDITVGSDRLYSVVADALNSSNSSLVRDVEISLAVDTADLAGAFFIFGKGLVLFGKFSNLSGYVEQASITVVKPTGAGLRDKLTSVQLKMNSQDTPTSVSKNLSQKLTKTLSPGTHQITPLTEKFSNLKYLGFFFEGEDSIYDVKFTARVILRIVK